MTGLLLTITVTNWLGIIVAAIAAMIVGFIWYSPMLFGKRWMKAEGINDKDSKKMMRNPTPMVLMFIAAIISALVLQIFFTKLGVATVTKGIEVAVGAWLFIATSSFGMSMFSKKPFSYYLIQVIHLLIGFILMGIILVLL